MYSPELIEQYLPNEYRGTLYTHKRQINETGTGSKRFAVDRPTGFIQRADVDIGSQVVLEKNPISITIPAAFHPDRLDTTFSYIPHVSDSGIDLPQFPLTQLTRQCRYKPEMSGEVYSSDPYELLRLAKILCPAQALQRRSKVDVTGYRWTTHTGEVLDEADTAPFASYEWDWRVHPSNTLIINFGGGRLGGSSVEYMNPEQQDTVTNHTSGAAFDHIRVRASVLRGEVSFSTRRDEISIPIALLTSLNPAFVAGGDAVEVKSMRFQIHEHVAVADSSGYAYFTSDKRAYSLGLEFVGGTVEYTDTGVLQEFDLMDMILTIFVAWANTAGDGVAEFEERIRRATTLQIPQCRFTLSHQRSIPGPGPQYGGGEDGIYYSSRLLSTLLPEDEYGMATLMDSFKTNENPNYEAHKTYTPAMLVRAVFFPAARSYYEFGLDEIPILAAADNSIAVSADGALGIITGAEPNGTHIALVKVSTAGEVDIFGFSTDPVLAGNDTQVTVHLPVGHGLNLAGATSYYDTNFHIVFTRAAAAGADPARLTFDGTTVYMAADLFAENGARARIMYTSKTLYDEDSDEWVAFFVATLHGPGEDGLPYLTMTDGEGNAINPTVGAGLSADAEFRLVQWPRYLDAVFQYEDEDLDANGRPQFTATINETLELFMGPGQRRTHVVCDCREAVLIGPLTPWGTIECNRPLGKRTAFIPPRLGTYELEFDFDPQVSIDSWLATYDDAALSLHAEFLSHDEDFPEQNILSCPLITKVLNVDIGEAGKRYSFVVQNGPPSWLYITHGGDPALQFTLEVGGRKSTTLGSLDKFDQFKLLARAAHPHSDYQYTDWKTARRSVLLRIEELGLFGEIKQWEDHIQFQLELNSNQLNISVYTIYDHYVFRDEQTYTKFLFIN